MADSGERGEEPRGTHDPAGARETPPASVNEALARAREHALAAAVELGAAARALLDAASLSATGAPSEAHLGLRLLSRGIEELVRALGRSRRAPASLLDALADALDAEIARWEERADEDPEARAVLRAYLGVREILWELGVRRRPAQDAQGAGKERARAQGRPAAGDGGGEIPTRRRHATARPRLQRVPVEG
jgi:hypothetical protein